MKKKYIVTLQRGGAHIETEPIDPIQAEDLMEAAANAGFVVRIVLAASGEER